MIKKKTILTSFNNNEDISKKQNIKDINNISAAFKALDESKKDIISSSLFDDILQHRNNKQNNIEQHDQIISFKKR